jgi:hypothetical protein
MANSVPIENRTAIWINPVTWGMVSVWTFATYLLLESSHSMLVVVQLCKLAAVVSSYSIGYRRRNDVPPAPDEEDAVIRVANAYDIGIGSVSILSDVAMIILLMHYLKQ